ncbi:MAG: thioredoxin family protein [Bacteroidota bacterium]
MKTIIKNSLFLLLLCTFIAVKAQTKDSLPPKIYNPQANAKAELASAVSLAKAQNKHVLIQVGGNWCIWCLRLHEFCAKNQKVDSTLKANYVFTLINFSKDNKNEEILSQFGPVQRFGYPVWLILDENGKLIHIQETGLLEEGKGYSEEKIVGVLNHWSKTAIDPKTYIKKQ